MDAAKVMRRLTNAGVGTRPFFYPMHRQPVLLKMGVIEDCNFPVADKMANYGFYLPSGLGIGDGEISLVSKKLIEVLS
jgi:perosamine synthetase